MLITPSDIRCFVALENAPSSMRPRIVPKVAALMSLVVSFFLASLEERLVELSTEEASTDSQSVRSSPWLNKLSPLFF